ncbi:urease accessory UreF family protein [Amycolatopsis rhabdoformis]|uniref:Urease accessory protein UreF n=1 Tax=Amycolatopsis rhabdoformis TaxID=1448059 RepID=A0ABZ1IDZ0_9PSEU|nr:urease accessory UreF family protein [Amycolatopsis rhabdoformis]WSE32684.1 urease accessory UreF family protein [Amycolatopsis rhabdoformis]
MAAHLGGAERLTGFLSVLQLSDSAFPSGRYTLSYGLETLVQSGFLATPSDPRVLTTLLRDQVLLGVAPSDGVALACAHRATASGESLDLECVTRADERLTAVKLAREARETSTRTGRALLRIATAVFATPALRHYAEGVAKGRSPGNHAVVLGIVSASVGVPRLEAVAGELFAFSAAWVAAAVRLAVTDHATAQAVLHDVRAATAEAARDAADQEPDDITSCTPLLDVAAMRHEETQLRLFAS